MKVVRADRQASRLHPLSVIALTVVTLFTVSWNSDVVVVAGSKQTSPLPSPRKSKTSVTRSIGGISSQADTSLRRIRKEYKEAVDVGIAYDWTNQKRILPSSKKKKTKLQADNDAQDANAAEDSSRQPNQYLILGPLNNNLRHWHFSFRGAGNIYGKGIYHGRIILPKDYPFSPPRVQMWTPSGRFKPQTDICLSASAYHPESWSPKLTVQGLVNALRFHMLNAPLEVGGITSPLDTIEEHARQSLTWRMTLYSGQSKIEVNHAKLLENGVISMFDDGSDTCDESQKDLTVSTTKVADSKSVVDEELANGIVHPSNSNHKPKKKRTKNNGSSNVAQREGSSTSWTPPQTTKSHLSHWNHATLMAISKTLTTPSKVICISLLVLLIIYSRK